MAFSFKLWNVSDRVLVFCFPFYYVDYRYIVYHSCIEKAIGKILISEYMVTVYIYFVSANSSKSVNNDL